MSSVRGDIPLDRQILVVRHSCYLYLDVIRELRLEDIGVGGSGREA